MNPPFVTDCVKRAYIVSYRYEAPEQNQIDCIV